MAKKPIYRMTAYHAEIKEVGGNEFTMRFWGQNSAGTQFEVFVTMGDYFIPHITSEFQSHVTKRIKEAINLKAKFESSAKPETTNT